MFDISSKTDIKFLVTFNNFHLMLKGKKSTNNSLLLIFMQSLKRFINEMQRYFLLFKIYKRCFQIKRRSMRKPTKNMNIGIGKILDFEMGYTIRKPVKSYA